MPNYSSFRFLTYDSSYVDIYGNGKGLGLKGNIEGAYASDNHGSGGGTMPKVCKDNFSLSAGAASANTARMSNGYVIGLVTNASNSGIRGTVTYPAGQMKSWIIKY